MRTFEEFGVYPGIEEFTNLLKRNDYVFEPFDEDGRIVFKRLL